MIENMWAITHGPTVRIFHLTRHRFMLVFWHTCKHVPWIVKSAGYDRLKSEPDPLGFFPPSRHLYQCSNQIFVRFLWFEFKVFWGTPKARSLYEKKRG
jgi:hypothetical protein